MRHNLEDLQRSIRLRTLEEKLIKAQETIIRLNIRWRINLGILKKISRLADEINRYGILIVIARFRKVHWKQDFAFKNGGRDIISLYDKSGAYFTGTYRQRNKFFQQMSQ